MIPWLGPDDPFPPLAKALRAPNGLLCAGADLSAPRLVDAYSRGIFPWFSEGDPILWWSPDPRMVLYPDELKVSRSLRRVVARGVYDIRVDTAFPAVIEACAARRHGHLGTWILPEMVAAYIALHDAGFAHSVEAWKDGALAGGLYGVALGKVFFGESMFTLAPDASKAALVALVERLQARGFRVIDCQQATAHLASLGAREIPRRKFAQVLEESIQYPLTSSRWDS